MRKSAFSTVLLAGIAAAILISIPKASAEPNLVSWWKLDEGSGTTAYDSADGHNGTLVNGPVWVNGQIDGALSFDGADDYVNLGNSSGLKPPLPVTISMWIKLNTGGCPLSLDQPSYGIACFANNDYVFRAFYYDGGGGGSSHRRGKIGTTVLAAGRWYHMAAVIRGQTDMNIYVDGADDGGTYNGTGGDLVYSSDNSYIGRYSTQYFNGVIDDVRVYDRALTAEEIGQIYQEGTVFSKATSPNPVSGTTGVDPNIVLRWKPGKDAASHDVYFGTDYEDVNEANTVSPEYKGNFDVNNFDPCGLGFHTTYYWRVDEVNGANVWKGNVWNFKISDDDGKLHVPSEYSTIQEAINTSRNGDVVIVAPGTYYENVQILNKGITLRGEDPCDPCKVASTIINGGQSGSVINIDSTVTETIAGLTVTNGLASAGGGIKCSTAGSVNVFIRNCRITGNRTTDGRDEWTEPPPYYTTPGGDGAGIYCSTGVYLELTGCLIANNICGRGGSSFYDCSIPGCKGGSGGGIYCIGSGIKIGDCQIIANHSGDGGDGPTYPLSCYTSAGEGGGGGGLYSSCSADINETLFEQNTAGDSGVGRLVGSNGGKGGGIYSVSSSANIRNSQFIGNTSGYTSGCLFCDYGESYGGDGGGIYRNGSAVIENCLIIQNAAGGGTLYEGCHSGNGGGIYCQSTSIKNCTIANNTIATSGQGGKGGGIYAGSGVSVRDSIMWGNNAQANPQIYGSPTVSYSDVQGGFSGTGNINADPCFADPCNGDYHLKSQAGRWNPTSQSWVTDAVTSLCIDAGNPGCPLGNEPSNANNVRINMGAYGGTAEASKTPADWRSIADLTNDWAVDFNDLGVFVSYWLDSGECIPSDLNRNGTVNFDDYAIFAQQWPGVPVGEPGIEYEISTCEGMGMDLSATEQLDGTRFTVTVEGRYIHFEDMMVANCCPDKLELQMTVEGNLITINEVEYLTMPCHCICNYPVTATLGPFEPGTYTFEVYNGGFIGSTVVTIEY
jgi:hypothetical protein